MIKHINTNPISPNRVVVLGANGFIGGEVVRLLRGLGIVTLSIGRGELDLSSPNSARELISQLRVTDTIFYAAAKAPVKNLKMFQDNINLLAVLSDVLKNCQPQHLVYLSSDAVYKDSSELITENSCAEPASLHGAMHLTREISLKAEYDVPLAIVRPTLVYGFNDPHNSYGPNRFRMLAQKGMEIKLFGYGEELRDHIDVRDVANIILQVILHKSVGIINAVSGNTVSFLELAEYSASLSGKKVLVTKTPRIGLIPHNGYRAFNNYELKRAFPGLLLTPWREGLMFHFNKNRLKDTSE